MVKVKHQSFPSWVDLPHVYDSSSCLAFYFRDCQNFFCQLITLSDFTFFIFPIPGTFHPKRWSLSSPRCPASNIFPFHFNPLNLALTRKAEVSFHPNALSSPLSCHFLSKALPNI